MSASPDAPSALRSIRAVLVKDLRTGWRARTSLIAMLLFAALMLTVFALALPEAAWSNESSSRRLAAGILWVAIAFGGVLGLNQTFAAEREGNTIEGLLLTPIDRGHLYLAKFLANLVFLLGVEIPLTALHVLFFNAEVGGDRFLPYLFVLVLGTVGFTASGTLFAAMSSSTRSREVLLPLILLPIATPILLAGVECTATILEGYKLTDLDVVKWVKLMVVFDVVSLVASFLTFEFLVEE